MFPVSLLAQGLLVAHIFLALSFLLGSIILPWRRGDVQDAQNVDPSEVMTWIVCTCALGIAMMGFLDFALALTRCFSAAGLAIGYLALCAGLCALARESPFRATFWASRLRAVAAGWDISFLFVYYAMLALAFPAILPNLGGSDPIAFHLANAADLVRYHGFVVNPFRRTPFYVGGFIPIFGSLMTFNADAFANFLTWSTGLLTALGVCAVSKYVMREAVREPWRSLIAVAMTTTVIANPVYLRWGAQAYMDVQIGCFALLSVITMIMAAHKRDTRWFYAAAITSGFLIGMKPSFLTLAPLYPIALLFAMRSATAPRGRAALVLLVFLAAASPWYVRNTVLAGDPIPPVFNIALYGRDGLIAKSEWTSILADIHTSKTASAFATLPYRAYFTPRDDDFRENGTSAIFLALYIPAALCLILLFLGRKIETGLLLVTWFLTMFAVYWFASSTLLRYALLFMPLLGVAGSYLFAMLASLAQRWRFSAATGPALVLLALLAVIPSPGSAAFYDDWNSHYQALPMYQGFEKYLPDYGNGDAEALFTIHMMQHARFNTHVYVLGAGIGYYFSRAGITSMGDWIGPAGWFRLYDALDAGQLNEYLRALGAGAVLIEPSRVIGGLDVPLTRALVDADFCSVRIPNSSWQLYVHDPNICSDERNKKGTLHEF